MKFMRLTRDLVSVGEFRARWGDHALIWLKLNKRLVKLGGKRRAVMAMDYKQGWPEPTVCYDV